MMELKQSTATYALVFYMVDDADGYTPLTGLSPTVTLSKNGGSFASPSGAVTEISGGFYKVAGNATDSNTLGILALKATASGAVPVAMAFAVVANIQSDAISSISGLNNITAAAAATAVRTELATELARIDASISSRNATTPPTAAAIADAVWDEATSGHTTAGSTGKALTDAGSAGDPWATALPGAYSAGSAGQIIGDRIDATISSRNATTPPTASTVAGAVRTELTTELARIDAAISSRNSTTPPTAAAIADAVWDEPTSGHTTAGSTGKALTDLEAGGAATPAEIADAVWDETLAAHATAGSAGAGLAAASASGDPWASVLPGAYATGTAGAGIGRLNLVPEAGPVVVIPDPSSDAGQCVLFIDTRSFNGTIDPGVQIRVTPIGGPARTAGGRVVGLEERLMTTDADGRATMTVERTDLVIPAGSITYQITAATFKLNATIAPVTDTFNLAELILS